MKIKLSGYAAIAIALTFLACDLMTPGYRKFAPYALLQKNATEAAAQTPIAPVVNSNNCSNPQYKAIVESLKKGQCK